MKAKKSWLSNNKKIILVVILAVALIAAVAAIVATVYRNKNRETVVMAQGEDGFAVEAGSDKIYDFEFDEEEDKALPSPSQNPTSTPSPTPTSTTATTTTTQTSSSSSGSSTTTKYYNVTWLDSDGSVLKVSSYTYGQMPSYGSNPTKQSTAEYDYSFNGWTPGITKVTGDITYKAVYKQTPKTYTVTYKLDGAQVGEVESYKFGETVTVRSKCEREGYRVSEWSREGSFSMPAENVIITAATAGPDHYLVTWKNADGRTIKTDSVKYGALPKYQGAVPTTAPIKFTAYKFKCWDREPVEVTEDATYTAVYDTVANKDAKYEDYLAATPEEQLEFMYLFPSMAEFSQWEKNAKQEYEKKTSGNIVTIIDGSMSFGS